jgi:hypothetical protein
MIRNVKILGLLVVAAMAMSAMVASAASAVEFHSDSSTGNTWLTNTTTTGTSHKFDAAGNTITCTTASFKSTQAGNTATAIKAEATYGNCTFFGVAVSVNMGKCAYEFKANGEVAVVDRTGVDCNSEKITFKGTFLGASCHVEIGEQVGLKSVTYDGASTAVGTVTVTPAVTNIAYKATGALCSETGELTNGSYTSGTTTMTGYKDEGGVEKESTPIWVS